ncbi:MAG: hypothetical protein AAGF01_18175 [Cyanobacteria bacterium P01_G01_bin.38]
MDAKLAALLAPLQKPDLAEADYQLALNQLADEVLRSRKIGRSYQGQFPAPLYQDLYDNLRNQVLRNLTLECDRLRDRPYNLNGTLPIPENLSWDEWATRQRFKAARAILTDECLSQLAQTAQQYPSGDSLRQYALSELVQALRLVKQADTTAAHAPDTLNRTLSYVCEKIEQYDPKRGPVIAWVNYHLKLTPGLIQQEQQDKVIQSSRRKLFRTRLMLKRLMQSASLETLLSWLYLYLKKLINQILVTYGLIPLTFFHRLSHLYSLDRSAVETFLFDLAAAVIHTSPKISFAEPETAPLENISTPNTHNTLSDEIRQYLETDPDQILQKHIQGCRRATFQTIALARLNGQRWSDLAAEFNIAVPTLSSFYERTLKQIAPRIKEYIQI